MKTIAIAALVAASVSQAGAQALPGGFVYLRDIDPTIIQDIRYAGANNFVGRPLSGYGAAECVVKREIGLALKNVQQELAKEKLSLKMFDCYRPVRAVADMVAWSRDGKETATGKRYNPAFAKADLFRLGYIATHSGHSTGRALDLTWWISPRTIRPGSIRRNPMPPAPRPSRRGRRRAASIWEPAMIVPT
jgi:D-alanyl-D-alanine dipeptidase